MKGKLYRIDNIFWMDNRDSFGDLNPITPICPKCKAPFKKYTLIRGGTLECVLCESTFTLPQNFSTDRIISVFEADYLGD